MIYICFKHLDTIYVTTNTRTSLELKKDEVNTIPIKATVIHKEKEPGVVNDIHGDIGLHSTGTLKVSNFIVSVGGMSFPFRTAFHNLDQVVKKLAQACSTLEILQALLEPSTFYIL